MPFTQEDKDRLLRKTGVLLASMDLEVTDIETASGIINLYGDLVKDQGEIISMLVKENEELNRGLRNEGL